MEIEVVSESSFQQEIIMKSCRGAVVVVLMLVSITAAQIPGQFVGVYGIVSQPMG